MANKSSWLAVTAGLELGVSKLQVQRSNGSITLPPVVDSLGNCPPTPPLSQHEHLLLT